MTRTFSNKVIHPLNHHEADTLIVINIIACALDSGLCLGITLGHFDGALDSGLCLGVTLGHFDGALDHGLCLGHFDGCI